MICANCGVDSTHIKTTPQGETCHNCGGFAQASGVLTDGALARNSFRVREQQSNYEVDTLPPHIYDRTTRRAVPNPEFIKRFPETAHINYTPEELHKAKLPELARKVEAEQKRPSKGDKGVKFRGNTKEGIKNLTKSLDSANG